MLNIHAYKYVYIYIYSYSVFTRLRTITFGNHDLISYHLTLMVKFNIQFNFVFSVICHNKYFMSFYN